MESPQQTNPLSGYFRHPEIYINLPSGGSYYPEGFLNLSQNNQLGIRSMTTADELLLQSPDGLLNGESVARIIQSCTEGIADVYQLTSNDVDAILLAIRQASYGNEMEFDSACPNCKETNRYAAQLDYVLSTIESIKPDYSVELDNGLIVHVNPRRYTQTVKESLRSYEEAQIVKMIMDEDLDEVEKASKYSKRLENIAELLIELNAECIKKIVNKDGNEIQVTLEQLKEWYVNIPKKHADKINNLITEISNIGVNTKFDAVCQNENCKHEWVTEVTFDPSHFFG